MQHVNFSNSHMAHENLIGKIHRSWTMRKSTMFGQQIPFSISLFFSLIEILIQSFAVRKTISICLSDTSILLVVAFDRMWKDFSKRRKKELKKVFHFHSCRSYNALFNR